MRVFVTGASGFIGSALVPDLIAAGHQVVGLARSDASAAALTAVGAEVRRGTVEDLDSLRAGAAESEGVIHLAFNHDFTQHEAAARAELRAIETFGDALEGSDRPLVIATGGPVGTEQDAPPASASPRNAGALAALALAERGVRSSIVRLAPTVHDQSKRGLVGQLVDIAREKGVSGYLGDGFNRWPSVHRLDAARLFRLAVEKAPAGSVLHGVGEEGVAIRAVAEVIGRHLNVPVTAVAAEDAGAHFGFLSRLIGLDMQASNALTRELLGWQPTHPGLIDDLDNGHHFDS
ncbi:SDR family oxidoreductase [Streptomyces lunaelactis]|uniref:SDR family oxidoreductase n=1 Tax=Streptomyces lunaelactis TaxID=1535768 RepID=UPI001585A88D|nr:SDR family oxidoreductase [Streptomyces lunaelactis]NUL05717.1 SDR family oxidoreductase [Streptomyces lunaelactis]